MPALPGLYLCSSGIEINFWTKLMHNCSPGFVFVFISALWACTSECRILGHSDRCWSPNATRMNSNSRQHLSTFAKTGSLPRDTLRRDNYCQAHIPKTVGLQSVYERVLHQEYVIVPPPQPSRTQDINDVTIPVYSPTTARCSTNEV